ncbi:carbohydrate ABC transporter permease [Rhabdaerophilum calidifontis]|uniref:carbohydrate ABC transporter permease n=1 Tax=Rhabdaerophilum calidifontis TaxID=2604328 RepID=UPI001239528D|nr:sugar ABC transporter permease [Rhabdaerophilum calidifontis]
MAEIALAALPATKAPARRAGRRRLGRTGFLLTLPALLLMLALLIGPVLAVIIMSLTDYQLGAAEFAFIGLRNYAELFADKVFWKSLGNTLAYAAIVVPGSVALGLGIALLIQAGPGLRAFYRAVFFVPVMATLIAMAISWEFMLHAQFGLINLTLKALGLTPRAWLAEPDLVLPTLAVIGIWQLFGFNMVLFLAGLVSIPRTLYDAAAMDGARSALARFRLVTWPMLGPVTMFVVIISAIRSFQVFDTVHVLTKGGPSKSSEVLLYSMYSEGFEFFRSGLAAAIAVVFLGFVLVLTLVKARVIEKKVHYS